MSTSLRVARQHVDLAALRARIEDLEGDPR
jgi:hypothetical protein